MNSNYFAILMAGGVGSRFWPVSTAKNPKQFQDILGSGETMIQTTFKRLLGIIPQENIFILTHKNYGVVVKQQLPELSMEQIVLEPEMRNTAPSVLLGALKIRQKNKNAVIVVAPSDHWIDNQEKFQNDLKLGFDAVEKENKLLTLGIKPTSPKTGYGYLEFNKDDTNPVKKVLKFIEKPSLEKAEELLKEGNYVWNAGIFIWSAVYIIDCYKEYLPEMYKIFECGSDIWNTLEESEFIEMNYARVNKISIDYGIMEKSDKVFVIPATFEWNDLGTWRSLQEELPSDTYGNTVVNVQLLPIEAEGNIISALRNKTVIVEGLKDYIIVENDEVLLIVPKKNEQMIKEIRADTMDKFGDHLG